VCCGARTLEFFFIFNTVAHGGLLDGGVSRTHD
jgi:hypothetical protein